MAVGIAALIQALQFEGFFRRIHIAGKWRVVRYGKPAKEQGLARHDRGHESREIRIQIEMPR
jgi:hypothetical protein